MCSETQDTRVCSKCGVEKPLTDEFFYTKKSPKGKYYYRRTCKICHHADNLEDQRIRKYGIDAKGVEKMLVQQQHRCHICERKFNTKDYSTTPHVDHCHETGQVRGILCMSCNTGLGMFKDNVKLLKRAAIYLCEDIV